MIGSHGYSDEDGSHPKNNHSWGIVLIGIGKLTTGLLLAAAGFGIFHYLDRDLREVIERYVTMVRLDPDSRVVHLVVSKVSGIDHRHLREIGLGTFFYALLHLVEGTGLILRKRWAEYLTVVSTTSLIPIEVVASIKRMNAEKLIGIFINILIAIYVIVKLVQQHRARQVGRESNPVAASSPDPRGATNAPG